jgi:hypothetical protein
VVFVDEQLTLGIAMKKIHVIYFALCISLGTLLTSCYRMPTEDEYSLVPSTNNPASTRQRSEGLTPKMSY